ncbi:DnaJ-domain-containing protein [Testicularia cyperi]|uniref:DnaJ-domain-containing protein n=1 Tax=Testicularia cyperi TaxID=1882483 RepID=A0A317XQH2_9BASI|nr:DnaJ-domain-containing protein [Testicularia cyperi]
MSFIASLFYRAALSEESLKAPVGKVNRSRMQNGTPRDGLPAYGPLDMDTEAIEEQMSPESSKDGSSFQDKVRVIDEIIAEDNLYKVLGVKRNAKSEEIRRAFLTRSRSCHPDKFPDYPQSTIAFQKLAFAYETLSKPASRQAYELSPETHSMFKDRSPQDAFEDEFGEAFADATLQDVLFTVYVEFFEGDFTSVKALLKVLADSGLGTYNDANIHSIEAKFRKLSQLMRATRRYSRVLLNEVTRLYEIQQDLRGLSYFDIPGRLRLTLQLARVTLSIPLAIDQAMQNPEDYDRKEFGEWFEDMRRNSADYNEDDRDGPRENEESLGSRFGVRNEAESDAPGSDEQARLRYVRARDARIARRAAQRRDSRYDSEAGASPGPSALPSEEDKAAQAGFLGPTTTALFTGMIGLLEAGEGWIGGKPIETAAT